ncbi:Brain-enriched guanylate kinase-associated protein [Habropoda laboriosa]|uniref:Brain-enriched guanylate kinase-associated protein n=2 Tax=Habropoda laboriosa TaxID=597456 RepID=A0A0L7R7U1_9HYME|nr:Brain-enriched guanylate kinase-associated protein [Habropoda laboriosa]
MHLHVEIENLRQRLMERDSHIVTMETQFLNEADKFPNGELASMKEELLIWQEKYARLHEAHKRIQKVNQNLEDKLLRIVDKCETEKSAFTKDIATLSHRLADANYTIHRLTQDNEKYRNDVNLAIQLLQCKPANFVGQKYDSLPSEVQAKVRTYVAQKKRSIDAAPPDVKSITVPISTFPPTAMVYNVTKPAADKLSDDDTDESKPPVDIVSAAIMAKVLEDREKERVFGKHCDTCTCHRSILMIDAETQTNVPDTFSCNECTMKYAQNVEKHSDNIKSMDKNYQNKESQNSMLHVVYQEVNENISSKVQYQINCTKNSNYQQLCTRDKCVSRNGKILDSLKEDSRVNVNTKASLNKKNSMRRNDLQLQSAFQNQSENTTKQVMPQKLSETFGNGKMNFDKGKQAKLNKKCELVQVDAKFNANSWNKLEKKSSNCSHIVPENSKNYFCGKEQTHIDIINDRLWKNEWTKLKTQTNTKESKEKVNGDIEIDIINDRSWKNDKPAQETYHPAQLTLIEVKNIDSVVHQNDSGQMEVATSPSFSSDSIVISTSDPSSSSSDVVQSTGTRLHNTGNSKPNSQNRITGPRNCLVRVTPGSKNILLDNAGHYKTVLYTSGSNKPNTALVHSKKLSRSGSERSISTSSEESSPMLLHDNNQLQRVAEWVQSSVHMDNSGPNYTEIKPNENVTNKNSPLMYLNESQTKSKPIENNRELYEDSSENKCDNLMVHVQEFGEEKLNNGVNNFSLDANFIDAEKEKDLISFDVPTDEEKPLPKIIAKKADTVDIDYEVKITKEMEETYLKLAASLDPVTLSLSNTDKADITIEKYRKDHKRLQRSYDKAGSKV